MNKTENTPNKIILKFNYEQKNLESDEENKNTNNLSKSTEIVPNNIKFVNFERNIHELKQNNKLDLNENLQKIILSKTKANQDSFDKCHSLIKKKIYFKIA